LLAAASPVTAAPNDLLRVFFLVEGKPFPYAEKLMHFSSMTALEPVSKPTLGGRGTL
jgi:hypothetical protein